MGRGGEGGEEGESGGGLRMEEGIRENNYEHKSMDALPAGC